MSASRGIGKSRLAWELEKYVDGLVDEVRWHRGRSLAYGEGVAYWALAEMLRMRAGISEEDEPAAARVKLRCAIELQLDDSEERAWVEPRLLRRSVERDPAALRRVGKGGLQMLEGAR